MKFSEMPYERPDLESMKRQMADLTERLKNAVDYPAAREIFLEKERFSKHISTFGTLASVRHSIDTRNAFYDGEVSFWNAAGPQLAEYDQAWKQAMLQSPIRADIPAAYGDLIFRNAEIACGKEHACGCREQNTAIGEFRADGNQDAGYAQQCSGAGEHSGSKMRIFHNLSPPMLCCPGGQQNHFLFTRKRNAPSAEVCFFRAGRTLHRL